MIRTLMTYSLRHLWKQRWQSALLILGILLGVAVVIAIDFANESARQALKVSTTNLTGAATHEIVKSGGTIPDSQFAALARAGLLNRAAPIVEGYVSVQELDGQALQLFGIDPFWDVGIRDFYGSSQADGLVLLGKLIQPNQVILASELAQQNGLKENDTLTLVYEGRTIQVHIAALINTPDAIVSQSLQGLILTDIAVAQEVLGKTDGIDRIELIIQSEEELEAIRAALPPGMLLLSTQEKNQQINNLVGAFQLNLTALSLLALVVGLFLIYNTMTFSVVQRRETIGIYRSLGLYRHEVFQMVLFEALLLGVVGTILGIGVGYLMGKQTVYLILRTINDLYFVTTVKSAVLSTSSILKGTGLGLIATIVVSIPPAWEATRVSPKQAAVYSDFEQKIRRFLRVLFLLMLLSFALALVLLFSPVFANLWWAFAATFLAVLGFGILSAIGMDRLLPPLARFMARWFGLVSGMAVRILHRSITRTAVAVASLMVAISVTIGMTIMIESFRQTVFVWLSETLTGDVYVSVPSQFANQSSVEIDPALVDQLTAYPQSEKIDYLFTTSLVSGTEAVQINVITNDQIEKERIFLERSPQPLWPLMLENGVMLSEPLKNRLGLELGDTLDLVSNQGILSFPIVAVFNDYASNQGHALMAKPVYETYWGEMGVTAISYYLNAATPPTTAVNELNLLASGFDQELLIRDNQTLKADVIQVFDQTFAVTNALRLIATVVSIIGILSAVVLIMIDRKKDIGLLKALGIRTADLRRLVFTQTSVMGLFAGLFAVPTGIVISLILIYVINLRSFGWTIQLNIHWWYLVQGILIAFIAASFGGIYPVLKLERSTPLEVLRYE